MARREQALLALVEQRVFGWPRSPYLALLRHAGCTLGDVRALLRADGVEGTLRALRASGIYVTFEEFKGRKPIVRPGLELSVSARDFDNPLARSDFGVQSGGSTGAASQVGVNLDQIGERAPLQALFMAAHGVLDAPILVWRGILPDYTLGQLLTRARLGLPVQRWFSHIGWQDSRHWLKYGLATYYILACMRLSGMRVPLPEYAGVDRALVVARALAQMLETHGRCLLHTQVSRALRVCEAARAAGLDLTGATVRAGGEPPTPGKVRRIKEAGAAYIPTYSMTAAGNVGVGCAQPADGSDVHLAHDAFALLTYPYRVEGFGVTVPAFNLTALAASSSKVMLNVQMDDYGLVEERRCGCPLESYGYTTHLREILSYSKLTGEGVTLIGTEIVGVLEDVLPARFGGGPLDYQLMEDEDEQGFTRLALIIHPRVEIADYRPVIATVLEALRRSSPMADAARVVWQDARSIQVRRAEPAWTSRGKFLPLHLQRRLGGSERP